MPASFTRAGLHDPAKGKPPVRELQGEHRKAPQIRHQRDYDTALYKARHLIEDFFERLKHSRAITTRNDKTAIAFSGAIHLAASLKLPKC